MARMEFRDRRAELFGRTKDLQALVSRAGHQGITAVVGRPQMGKSWLLTELARFLSTDFNPPYCVGFTSSSGQTPDLLLRAVVDLYTRWLSDSTYVEQAKIVWEQQKTGLVEGAGKVVGSIFDTLSKAGGPASQALGGVVSGAFEGLAKLNQTLLTGGVQIPLLEYDQARDLVNLVVQIGKRPVILILDQWELSPSIEFEANTLKTFLRNLEDWQQIHAFIGLRTNSPAYESAKDLETSAPGIVQVYDLGPMDLEDKSERDSLVSFVRKIVPAAQTVDDGELLGIIDGYPGTIYQWTNSYNAERMQSRADLEARAADAQKSRFEEFTQILPALSPEETVLAIRLAMVSPGSAGTWQLLKGPLLGGQDETLLDNLRIKKVLEEVDPPIVRKHGPR